MYTVRYTQKALSDLRGIANYIAQDNPLSAITFIDELQERTNSFLATAPNGATPYKNETRYFVLRSYVVLYEVNEARKNVNVLHIVSGRTDWKRFD
jgi:plasmid stabilization system protein ParE